MERGFARSSCVVALASERYGTKPDPAADKCLTELRWAAEHDKPVCRLQCRRSGLAARGGWRGACAPGERCAPGPPQCGGGGLGAGERLRGGRGWAPGAYAARGRAAEGAAAGAPRAWCGGAKARRGHGRGKGAPPDAERARVCVCGRGGRGGACAAAGRTRDLGGAGRGAAPRAETSLRSRRRRLQGARRNCSRARSQS